MTLKFRFTRRAGETLLPHSWVTSSSGEIVETYKSVWKQVFPSRVLWPLDEDYVVVSVWYVVVKTPLEAGRYIKTTLVGSRGPLCYSKFYRTPVASDRSVSWLLVQYFISEARRRLPGKDTSYFTLPLKLKYTFKELVTVITSLGHQTFEHLFTTFSFVI